MARAVKDKPKAKRVPRTRRKAPPVTAEQPQVEGTALSAHRIRQASVSAILDETFGTWAQSNPELWERRAYLLLVGLVYERLATNEDDVSTDELIKLAKALAENRRVEAKDRKNRADDGARLDVGDGNSDSTANGRLPTQFADSIRQLYGVNVKTTTSDDQGVEAK